MSEFIPGRNGVLEALKAEHSINKIFFAEGNQEGSIKQIWALAKEKKIPVSMVPRSKLDEMYEGNHQGVIAAIAAQDYVEIEEILAVAKSKGEDAFILMLADIESPQNLGAIMRTADIAGVHGIIIPKNNSVGLNATVAKISAGATEYVPVARVSNLNQATKTLQDAGLWAYGADMAGTSIWKQDMKGPMLLVIGGEDKGIPRLLLENCDFKVSIPMKGHISSLNASVAASVVMYEIVRQRELAQPSPKA